MTLSRPNHPLTIREVGAPEPVGTLTISGHYSEQTGPEPDYQYRMKNGGPDDPLRNGDRLFQPKERQASFRITYQEATDHRAGWGVSYSIRRDRNEDRGLDWKNITIHTESTRFWKAQNDVHYSLHGMAGLSMVERAYHNHATRDQNRPDPQRYVYSRTAIQSDFLVAGLLHKQLSPITGYHLGLVSPFTFSEIMVQRAGLVTGLDIRPASRWRLHLSFQWQTEAWEVSARGKRIGVLMFMYPVVGSIPDRKLHSSPQSIATIGLQYRVP